MNKIIIITINCTDDLEMKKKIYRVLCGINKSSGDDSIDFYLLLFVATSGHEIKKKNQTVNIAILRQTSSSHHVKRESREKKFSGLVKNLKKKELK